MNPIGLSSLKWEDSSFFVICVEFSTLVQRIDRNGIDLGKTSLPPSPPQGEGKGEGMIPLPTGPGPDRGGAGRRSGRSDGAFGGTHPTGMVKLFNAFVLVVYFVYPFQTENFPCFIGSDRLNAKLFGNSNHFRHLFSIAFCHHALLQIEIVF
jgi:hypothetical protein